MIISLHILLFTLILHAVKEKWVLYGVYVCLSRLLQLINEVHVISFANGIGAVQRHSGYPPVGASKMFFLEQRSWTVRRLRMVQLRTLLPPRYPCTVNLATN